MVLRPLGFTVPFRVAAVLSNEEALPVVAEVALAVHLAYRVVALVIAVLKLNAVFRPLSLYQPAKV